MKRVTWCGLLCLVGVGLVQADTPTSTASATFTAKAVQTNIQAGGTVTVEVQISGAVNVAAYQVQLGVTGGSKGTLTLESMSVDRARQDFAFFNSGAEMLDVQDKKAEWVGLVRVLGGGDIVKPSYAATFTYRASADAAGAFKINIRTDNTDSFLLDGNAVQIPHKIGAAAEVTVGAPTPTRTEGRKKE